MKKTDKLKEFFKENNKVALGFSGGVDSSYLLYFAAKNDVDIRPYFVKTAFQPEFELEDALRLGRQLGIEINIIDLDIFKNEIVISNPKDRCYYCKSSIFNAIKEKALSDGYNLIIDGTNASDDEGDRPGIKALREISVRSPLQESGLTKDEIRQLSKDAGLFTWNKPAYACLATRIPTDNFISKEVLENIEISEGHLFDMGFSDFRVRYFHGAARLEFSKSQIEKAVEKREEIINLLKKYFSYVLLDLEGR